MSLSDYSKQTISGHFEFIKLAFIHKSERVTRKRQSLAPFPRTKLKVTQKIFLERKELRRAEAPLLSTKALRKPPIIHSGLLLTTSITFQNVCVRMSMCLSVCVSVCGM